MREPQKPYPPQRQSQKYTVKHIDEPLIRKEYICNEDTNFDEYLEDWKDSHDWKEGDPLPELFEFTYDNLVCNLAELMAKVPTNIDPSNVLISLHRDRYIDHVEFSVKIRKPTDPVQQQKDFNQDKAEYQKAEAQYQKDLAAYTEWFATTEIAKKEKELADLKKHLKPKKQRH